MGCYEKNNKLTLTEAMEQYNKKFKKFDFMIESKEF